MKKSKKENLFEKINSWFRNLMLNEVDKEYDGPLPYHKKFREVKKRTDKKNERIEPGDWFNSGNIG
ncbi:hypothetical protein [Xanthomarina gelatinilytica]|uniref:hypothetical protein n=1 Tax=Xanthomarina gelatinilytica TaxID=1137281 RepID=UPI003AA997AE|tara:strand:- start:85 stop:282 length:198 start_codon:yes stop_codon:yes gene_type:complete